MRYHTTSAGNIPFTAEEEAARDAEEAQAALDKAAQDAIAAQEALKLSGVEILGIMCSATNRDQNGMTAIGLATMLARSGGGTLPATVMQFENGNSLTITDANFNQVQALWLPFRQSFFAAG